MNYDINLDTHFIATKPSEEQTTTLEKSKFMGTASLKLANVIRDLSEASGMRQATLFIQNDMMTSMIEKTRQDAIQELLACVELLGGNP